jgi:cellulose 1,4-beta-cellobiosidase
LAASSLAFQLYNTSANPFETTRDWYVNPAYKKELQGSIDTCTNGSVKSYMEGMAEVPSAYWIDTKSKISGDDTSTMEGILKDAMKKDTRTLVTFIVYDVPNRDCRAKASNGEICCTYNADRTCDYNASGSCEEGIQEYKSEYVDPMYAVLQKYQNDVEIVLIIEPDSLPNLATNLSDYHCGNSATQASYKKGIEYTINKFKDLNVTMYLDAAHGGWLGWEDNIVAFVNLLSGMQFDIHSLRGFSTNVANYQPLGKMCPWDGSATRNDYCLPDRHNQSNECCYDPCHLENQWNGSNNEMNFVQLLTKVSQNRMGYTPHNVVDTGRNGNEDMRQDCANWCNIRNAGVGRRPTTDTGYPEMIDAFFWLKTPGESDGCT